MEALFEKLKHPCPLKDEILDLKSTSTNHKSDLGITQIFGGQLGETYFFYGLHEYHLCFYNLPLWQVLQLHQRGPSRC